MKKLSVIVLSLIMVLSMIATAHAAKPDIEGTWRVDTATYTQAGADFMNEYFPLDGIPWVAGYPYPAAEGALYIFTDSKFSSTIPASSESYSWVDDSTIVAADAYWSVSVSGDSMVLTEGAMGTAYSCTRISGGGGSGGSGDSGSGSSGSGGSSSSGSGSPNTADPFSLGMYATMAFASLGGIVALKKKRG